MKVGITLNKKKREVRSMSNYDNKKLVIPPFSEESEFYDEYIDEWVSLPREKRKTTGIGPYSLSDLETEGLIIPEGIKYLGSGCLMFSKITYCVLPDTLKTIDESAFVMSVRLENIKLGKNLKYIGRKAFSECIKIKNLTLPDSVVNIGERCFSWCMKLQSINIPKGMKVIKPYTFSKCRSLRNIVIPSNIVEICEGSFSDCSALENITIYVKSFEDLLFEVKKVDFGNEGDGVGHIKIINKCGDEIFKTGKETFQRCINLRSVIFKSDEKDNDLVIPLNKPAKVYYPIP